MCLPLLGLLRVDDQAEPIEDTRAKALTGTTPVKESPPIQIGHFGEVANSTC